MWQKVTAFFAGFLLVPAAFFAGIGVERSSDDAAAPGDDGPVESRVQQVGQPGCNLRLPSGYTKDEGCPVAVGKGFRAGFHTVRDGWTIRATAAGPVLTATVWNNNPGSIREFRHAFHLNRYDRSLVEIVWCETEPFMPGQSRVVTCKPLQPKPSEPYDEVRIVY